jgi:hypothetical protein
VSGEETTFERFFGSLGEVFLLFARAVREIFRRPFETDLTVVQLAQGGVDSWSITMLTAAFTGMVMASQFAIGLEPFGASMYTGKLVGLGIVRELGPVLTSLLVGGRVGAGFTAEIGAEAVRNLLMGIDLHAEAERHRDDPAAERPVERAALECREVDLVAGHEEEHRQAERIWMNSACDWGISDPLAVPRTMLEMKKRGWTAESIQRVVYENPVAFMGQCEKFVL